MLPSHKLLSPYREPLGPNEQQERDRQLKARAEAKEAEKRLTEGLSHVQYAERLTRKALDKLGEALDSSISTNQHWATEMVLKHLYKVPNARPSAPRAPQPYTDTLSHDGPSPTYGGPADDDGRATSSGHIYIRGLKSDLL